MPDSSTYKIILSAIGATAVISTVGIISLSTLDKKIPSELNSIAMAAIGALGGILSPSPVSRSRNSGDNL